MSIFTTRAKATSILELLTHPNPPVEHTEPTSRTQSRHPHWHYPRRVKPWEEFQPSVIREIHEGLFEEAGRPRQDLRDYPTVFLETDCLIRDEDDTRGLVKVWNERIVMAALNPILAQYQPVVWRRGDVVEKEKIKKEETDRKKRHQPDRSCSRDSRKPRMQSLARLRADSGSVLLRSASSKTSSKAQEVAARAILQPERFPKEYKPASKWKSDWVFEKNLIENEEWVEGHEGEAYAMPINQAFTYCIQNMCRYGCIITCHEAFIFRIGPQGPTPSDPSSMPRQEFQECLANNGFLEYVSVPWSNDEKGSSISLDKWTINLALWFMHILAGNKYEVDWTYAPLKDEQLAMIPASYDIGLNEKESDSDGEESDSATSRNSTSTDETTSPLGKKRKQYFDQHEGKEEDDVPYSSQKRTAPYA